MGDQHAPSAAAIAGVISALVCRFTVAPLDLLKIRFQLQHAPVGSPVMVEALAGPPPAPHHGRTYTSKAQAIKRIWTEEGVTALWR